MELNAQSKALITGSASGIGRATAQALARLGVGVILTDINEAGLNETADLIGMEGGSVLATEAFDIADYEAVGRFAERVHREIGALDLLINNAGVALFALVEDMTHDHWKRVIDVDLWGPIHGIECFLPEMIKRQRGYLVNVSSTAGLTGAPWHAAYSTAKWGLVGLSEVLRYDLMQHHIGVSVICPGAVDTPIKQTVEFVGVDKESRRVQSLIKRFDRHAVTPERVAELILHAIKKEKFLVITSWDIKFVYLMKRIGFPVYHQIMKTVSRLLNGMKR